MRPPRIIIVYRPCDVNRPCRVRQSCRDPFRTRRRRPASNFKSMTTRTVVGALLLAVTSASCGGGSSAAGGGGGGAAPSRGAMPAMAVEIVTLNPKPVEQLTEYVGTVKSRQSTNIQPQMEGYLTRIYVKSGARVARGTPLMEIDART